MKFFAEAGKYPKAGLFSLGHLLLILVCLLILYILIRLMIKNKNQAPLKVIKIISILVLLMEVSKIIWGISVGRYADWFDYLPLWFCSLFIPLSLMSAFTKGKLQHVALTFLFYGGIIGGIAYLVFPTTSIGRYPAFHFISFHSMIYHTLMIFTGIFALYNDLIKPHIKDLKWYFVITSVFCIISYILNGILDTNYMFLASYSNNPILKILYEATGKFYPLSIMLFQNLGTFFISLGLYKLLVFLFSKKQIFVKKSA
ncbi:MAG: YwaF family protein [Bacilli bacterium]|nr:YwaF family protein [Bacilli bacterium]